MFEVPGETVTAPQRVCGNIGSSAAWTREAFNAMSSEQRRKHPRCTRMPGHDGPCRVYSKTAEVMAQW